MEKIVYKTETGIAIIHPTDEFLALMLSDLRKDESFIKLTESEQMDTFYKTATERLTEDIPTDAEYKIVDESELPTDRTFRGAWDYDTLTEDVVKSKEIKKTSLRSDRESLFAANDVDLQNAIADGDDDAKAICITERNRLRDVTDLVDTCTTIDEIKAVSC